MRKKIVAGNWKMNKTLPETQNLIQDLLRVINTENTVEVFVAPSFVNLKTAIEQTKNSAVKVAAQNMYFAENGAYTGEVSANMLQSIGINTVILGHSERRAYFGETDKILKQKAEQAYHKNMMNIFCIGEKLEERQAGKHFSVVESQLKNALFDLPEDAFKKIVIAYEPVWAIGTGETATPEQAQEIHHFIREVIAKKYDKALADSLRILYGGSVKPNNAEEIFSQPDVDGGLIGGAALKADDFNAIIEAGKS